MTRLADLYRELRIAWLHFCCDRAGQRRREADNDYRAAWDSLMREINSRSPEQIARMERARGLRN